MEEDAQPKLFRYGTYYATPDNKGAYGVMRVLTIDDTTLHYSLFGKIFERLPTAEEVEGLTPVVAHVPQAIGAIFSHDYISIVHRDLEEGDLGGLRSYWSQIGATEEDIEAEAESIVEFSKSGNQVGFFKDGRAGVFQAGE